MVMLCNLTGKVTIIKCVLVLVFRKTQCTVYWL